jgi:hypothetical protein
VSSHWLWAAWSKAVSLAKERNAKRICDADAYESTIIAELEIAVRISPYLKNEVAKGESASANALREALIGKLMLPDLEHVSVGLNRGDSQRFVNERVCRH